MSPLIKNISALIVILIFIILLPIDKEWASLYAGFLTVLQFALAIQFTDALFKLTKITTDVGETAEKVVEEITE